MSNTIRALEHAIQNTKSPIDARFYQGVIALLEEDFETAQAAFLDVLSLDPSHADARTNLGVIALKENKPQQAITYFSEALGFDEHHENARNNLAATFIHHARFENALTHYKILLKDFPDTIEYCYNAGVAEMALGKLDNAKKHFLHVLSLDSTHSASLTNLASIASRLNQTLDAIEYLKKAQAANPKDSSSAFMLDALTQAAPQREPSLDYIEHLFDNYALNYEKHMLETLNYQTPCHIAKALHQCLPTLHVKRALDLGCGTGLSGVVLRELCDELVGVDLSESMLAEARRKAIYNALIKQDILAYLRKSDVFNLIIAADVLPYFGALDALFECIKQKLAPSGFFVFTHEICESGEWLLQKTARFAHHSNYIHTLAQKHQLHVKYQNQYIARKHNDSDLPVMLYTLQRTE